MNSQWHHSFAQNLKTNSSSHLRKKSCNPLFGSKRSSSTKQLPLERRLMTLLSISNSSVITTGDTHLYLKPPGFIGKKTSLPPSDVNESISKNRKNDQQFFVVTFLLQHYTTDYYYKRGDNPKYLNCGGGGGGGEICLVGLLDMFRLTCCTWRELW